MDNEIKVMELRKELGTILDTVFYRGKSYTITRHGKPLARLTPIEDTLPPTLDGVPREQFYDNFRELIGS